MPTALSRFFQQFFSPPRQPLTWRTVLPLALVLAVFLGGCAFVEMRGILRFAYRPAFWLVLAALLTRLVIARRLPSAQRRDSLKPTVGIFSATLFTPRRPVDFSSRPASFAAVMHLPNHRLTPLREFSGRAFVRRIRGAFLA